SYRYGTASFLNSYQYQSATGKDGDTLLQQAIAKTGLGEMNATVLENVKWMMSYIYKYDTQHLGDIPGSLFMALQTYIWDNQSDKSAHGDPTGDIDAGGFANGDTYTQYQAYYNWLLGQKANEDAALQKQVADYAAKGADAKIFEVESSKWAVLAQSAVAGRQGFFAYYCERKVEAKFPGGGDNPPVPEDGSVVLQKIDADTGAGLSGATFRVDGIGHAFTHTYTTGGDGKVSIPDLQVGASYKATEINAPEGYVLSGEPQTFYCHGEAISLTFRNHSKTSITLKKIDAATGAGLSGGVFNVYRDGQIIGSATTGGDGAYTLTGIVEGLYSFVEVSAPGGYQVDPTPHDVYVDVADGSKTYTVTATNGSKPDMELVKTDAQTGAAIAGTVFSIKGVTTTYSTSATTGADGKVRLPQLDAGVYVVTEESVPAPYVVSNTAQTVALQAGKTSVVTFTNYQKPGLAIIKRDIATGAPLADVGFKIEQIDGSYSTSGITDGQGRIFLESVPVGSYQVTEIAVPEGYILSGAVQTVALSAGTTSTLSFYNAQKPGLVIVKTDAAGNALPGVVFDVKLKDGSSIGTFTTGADGKITIPKLNAVWYTVTELYVGEEFILDAAPRDVLLRAGETYTLTVSNDRKPDLKIIKKDADTGAFLEGASYKVKQVDSATITTVTTGADGTVLLEHLTPGVYEITETIPPTGYLLPETVTQQITLEANKTGEVVFENHLKPTLTINKVDSITKDPIKGAKFHITYASNNTFTGELGDLGTYFTDEKGQIQLSKLTDGWYRVTEVEPAAGYSMKDPATQECYIQAGTGKVLTFENIPLSALVIKKVDADSGAVLQGAKFRVRYLGGTSGTGGTVIGE
ncbi:MAG: SpaA isopeptide-forming pilin-related protein, partial [Oscillospiraceae bacterium]